MEARTETQAEYAVTNTRQSIIEQALALLQSELQQTTAFANPQAVKDFLALHNGKRADRHVEVFAVMFLDSQSRMISIEDMFKGTLMQTSVYPREVVRTALRHNAAAVIFTHNHPSGTVQPSRADEQLTQTLKAALALVDVRVLDHIITSGSQSMSMAEHGLV